MLRFAPILLCFCCAGFAEDKNSNTQNVAETSQLSLSNWNEPELLFTAHPANDAIIVKCKDALSGIIYVYISPSANVRVGLMLVGCDHPMAQLNGRVTYYSVWAQADAVDIWVPASDMATYAQLSQRVGALQNEVALFKRARDGHCGIERKDDGMTVAVEEVEVDQAMLDSSHKAQLKRLVDLKFHEAAGMTKEEFRALAPKPASSDGVLIVNGSFVSIETQCRLLGVTPKLEYAKLRDIDPMEPKLYWLYDLDTGMATTNGMSADRAREWCEDEGRRPANVPETLAVYREHTGLLGALNFNCAGSWYADGPGRLAPHLSYDTEHSCPVLRTAWSNRGDSGWSTPSFRKP